MKKLCNIVMLLCLSIGLTAFGEPPEELRKLNQGITLETYKTDLAILTGEKPLLDDEGREVGRIRDRVTEPYVSWTRKYLTSRLIKMGFEAVVVEPFDDVDSDKNLYVEIKGSETPSEIILLGAHYDTTGKHRPGANDNGTGVAAVLSIAQSMKESGFKPKRTIRFVLFDGEESGIRGSKHHIRHALSRGDNIKLLINIDMIGHSPSGLPFAAFDPGSFPEIEELVNLANSKGELGFTLETWGTYISDQLSGAKRGIPSVSIFEDARDADGEEVGYDPYNHSKEDTFDKVNLAYATKMTQLIGSTTMVAAQGKDHWSTPQSEVRQEKAIVKAQTKKHPPSCIVQILRWGKRWFKWLG